MKSTSFAIPSPMLPMIVFSALMVAVAAFLVNQVYELDVWWHVVIGRDILAQGSVPTVDRYAMAALGRPYHDSHWIFQIVLAFADQFAGMLGVQLVMIGLWMGILFCAGRAACSWATVPGMILLFLAAMASVERFLPRPELLTFLGVSFFYWRLQAGRYRTFLDLAMLVAMQLVWVNGHGLFVIGPFMVGCYWLAAFVKKSAAACGEARALATLLVLLLLATLVTPYGWGNWQYAALLVTEAGPNAPKMLSSLGELSPTFGPASRSGCAFWFFLALLLATIFLGFRSLLHNRSLPLARTLIVAGMLAAAMTGRRNMVLFALVAAPFCAELWVLCGLRWREWERFLVVAATPLMLAWAWYPLSGNYYLKMEIPSRFGLGVTPSFFPHGLPEFLRKIDYQGRVFNSNTLGGFYLYHAYPKGIPFTDGRWEIYDLTIFDAINAAGRSTASWQRFAQRYDFSGVLLQHASPEAKNLLPILANNVDWRLVYLDRAASFWLRADSGVAVPVVPLGAMAELPQVRRIDDSMMLDIFFNQVSANTLRVRNLERAMAFGQRTEWVLTALGSAQIKAGHYNQALQTFEKVRQEFPRNVIALNELAFLAYQQGELSAAEQLLREALRLDAENEDARLNYNRIQALQGAQQR